MLPDWALDPEAPRTAGPDRRSVSADDHRECTPQCTLAAAPSPFNRDRPTNIACPHCGANAGEDCMILGPGGRRRRMAVCHTSRRDAA